MNPDKGNRVIHIKDGSIGYVESIDSIFAVADVRWLTPDNEPSCCIGICYAKDLKKIPDHIMPMPKSKAWKKEAKNFHEMVLRAILDHKNKSCPYCHDRRDNEQTS